MRTIKAELVDLLIEYAADDYNDEQYRVVEGIVGDAIEEVRNARFPFGFSSESERRSQEKEVLARYKSNVRRISQYHYDKIGKEGVTTFYESGQTTSWEKGGTPNSFFSGIIPVTKRVK